MTLLDRVEQYHDALFNGSAKEAHEMLFALLGPGRGEWRKVADELPANDCMVWVACESNVELAEFKRSDGTFSYGIHDDRDYFHPSHWQPVVFPDPPQ